MDLTDLFRIVPRESTTLVPDVVKLPGPENIGFGPNIGGPGGPGGPIGVPRAIDLDRAPRTIAQPSPDYPYALKHDGVDGSVTVEFIVGTDGRVISAEAVKWTRREFVDSAVKAVLRWRFEPGTMNGRKVRFRMAVPIEFNSAG
jgi:protein TonB